MEVQLHFPAIVASTFSLKPVFQQSSSSSGRSVSQVDFTVQQSRRYEEFPPTTFSTAIQLSTSIIDI